MSSAVCLVRVFGFGVECVSTLKGIRAIVKTILWLCARNKPTQKASHLNLKLDLDIIMYQAGTDTQAGDTEQKGSGFTSQCCRKLSKMLSHPTAHL